jgi:hypothetical protein
VNDVGNDGKKQPLISGLIVSGLWTIDLITLSQNQRPLFFRKAIYSLSLTAVP